MFVLGPDRSVTDKRIIEELALNDAGYDAQQIQDVIEEFAPRPGVLYAPDNVDVLRGDLEYTFGLEVWADREYPFDGPPEPVKMEAVLPGHEPSIVTEAKFHPRWDDDAFAFTVHEA